MSGPLRIWLPFSNRIEAELLIMGGEWTTKVVVDVKRKLEGLHMALDGSGQLRWQLRRGDFHAHTVSSHDDSFWKRRFTGRSRVI